MKIYTTYKVKIHGNRKAFQDTALLYRKAVDWYISLCLSVWDRLPDGKKQRLTFLESISVTTAKRPVVEADFSAEFYKFPSYLRRAAINEAAGKVSSYKSILANWKALPPADRKSQPAIPKAGHAMPAMYNGNCYVRLDDYTAKIKVFIRNTWDWVTVSFRKSDADYITRHCSSRKECVPTLRRRGKAWYLDFSFEETAALADVNVFGRTALAADLGINSACAVSILRADGTVTGRRFLSLPGENDCLTRRVGRIRRAQSHGAKGCRRLTAT